MNQTNTRGLIYYISMPTGSHRCSQPEPGDGDKRWTSHTYASIPKRKRVVKRTTCSDMSVFRGVELIGVAGFGVAEVARLGETQCYE